MPTPIMLRSRFCRHVRRAMSRSSTRSWKPGSRPSPPFPSGKWIHASPRSNCAAQNSSCGAPRCSASKRSVRASTSVDGARSRLGRARRRHGRDVNVRLLDAATMAAPWEGCMDAELAFTSALDQADLIRRGEVSPGELVDGLPRAHRAPRPSARLVPHRRRRPGTRPRRATPRSVLAHGDVDDPPFLGVPISIKDLDDTAGIRTTHGTADVRRPHSRARRRGGRPHPARRLRDPRQDEHARVRLAPPPPRARPTRPRATRGTPSARRAGRPAGRRAASPPGSSPSRTAPTAAGRSASPRRGAGWWG